MKSTEILVFTGFRLYGTIIKPSRTDIHTVQLKGNLMLAGN